jgi:tripartite-type tricarboxylate transporter receptor subunit TctC
MKKILALLLLATLSLTVSAKETWTIVYSWQPSDPAAGFYRTLIEEANKSQQKYRFVIDFKPGAGGSIAARHVESTPNTILANSSALFIRPLFFPESSHNVANFRSLMPMCVAPMLVFSGKYKSWNEVPKDKPLSIGMSGLGTTTHLVATQIAVKYPNINIIPFKSTSEALSSAVAGNTDFSVGFMGEINPWLTPVNGKQVYVLGVTGKDNLNNIKPLTTYGFPEVLSRMSSHQQLFASRKMPDTQFNEIREIFVTAARHHSVVSANALDFCKPNNQMPTSEIDHWFNTQLVTWRRIFTAINP